MLTLHQDDEDILDASYPICVVSLGATREITFWDSNSEHTGSLVKKIDLFDGTLVAMLPGCQKKLWHKVPCASSRSKRTEHLFYVISFRKLASDERVADQEFSPSLPPSTPARSSTAVDLGTKDREIK